MKKRRIKYKNVFKLLLIIVLLVLLIKFCFNKKVKDITPPTITLEGGDITIMLNEDYQEKGYIAFDDIDKDITKKVIIKNNIDNKTPGEYEIIYTVKDSSSNETYQKRKVTVLDSPLNMSVKDFKLDGYYDSIKLKETEMQTDEYLKDFVFVGDSIPNYYGMYDAISGHQLWTLNGLDPETAKTTPININYGNDGSMLMVEAFSKYKPKYALITLGTNCASWMKPNYYILEYKELIDQIKEKSPNTKIIIQSIPPIDISLDTKSNLTNKKINDLNFYLLKMCYENNISFLDSESVMKDENGTCIKGYCQEVDGFHHTKEGIKQLVIYLKSHSL